MSPPLSQSPTAEEEGAADVVLSLPLDVPDEDWDAQIAAHRVADAAVCLAASSTTSPPTAFADSHFTLQTTINNALPNLTARIKSERAIATGLHISRLWSVANQLGLMQDEAGVGDKNSSSNTHAAQSAVSLAETAVAAAASLPTKGILHLKVLGEASYELQSEGGRRAAQDSGGGGGNEEVGDILASAEASLQCGLDDMLGISDYIASLETLVTRLHRQNNDLKQQIQRRHKRVPMDENTILFETLIAAYANSY